MDVRSDEGRDIKVRFFRAKLEDHSVKHLVRDVKKTQEFGRTKEDILVRHDIAHKKRYTLNKSKSEFMPAPEQVFDTTRSFTKSDLLVEPNMLSTLWQYVVDEIPSLAVGTIAALIIEHHQQIGDAGKALADGAVIGLRVGSEFLGNRTIPFS